MAELADRIDHFVSTFDGMLTANADTMVVYVCGMFVFTLFVFVFLVYGKNRATKCRDADVALNKVPAASSTDARETVVDARNGTESAAPTSAIKVLSSPTVRRRFGSKSAHATYTSSASTKRKVLAVPPSATGADVDAVRWVNSVFGWLYTDAIVANDLAHRWIQALNQTMKPTVAEHGVDVELIRTLPEASLPPVLNNLLCERAADDDLKITCNCEATPAMQLKAFRRSGDETVETLHYRLTVDRLRCRLNIVCVPDKLNVRVKFDGWPEIKVILVQVGSLRNNNPDEPSLREMIGDIVSSAVRGTSVNFNFSVYPSCPRFKRTPVSPAQHLPLHYDPPLSPSQRPSKLTVKAITANRLAPVSAETADQFCVVEVDDPPQTNQTKSVRGSDSSPVWNEQLIFDVDQRTKEVTFKVYNESADSDKPNTFLGLATVSLQELIESASQRKVVALHSRSPYQSGKVSGTLSLEFAFSGSSDLRNGTCTSMSLSETKVYTSDTYSSSTIKRENLTHREYHTTSDAVVERATSTVTATPNKTTLNQHNSNAPQPSESQIDVEDGSATAANSATIENAQPNGESTDRGRTRNRWDFFSNIRKRLNRSRSRGKAQKSNNAGYTSDSSEPASPAAAARPTSQLSRTSSARVLRASSLLREGSTPSSLSRVSGVSGASSGTYLNESSTLLLEVTQNNTTKYYLVPLEFARKKKWTKNAVKLHVFNEHVFVAKHLAGGTVCEVCRRTLPRRLGKQGYECRDCRIKCHKRCHTQTDVVCPRSSVPNLELTDVLTQSD